MRHAIRSLIGAISAITISTTPILARSVAPASAPRVPTRDASDTVETRIGDLGSAPCILPSTGTPAPRRRCLAHLAVQGARSALLQVGVGGLATLQLICDEEASAATILLESGIVFPALVGANDLEDAPPPALAHDLQSSLLAFGLVDNEALGQSLWRIGLAHIFLVAPTYRLSALPGLR